jgi:hypothetical protein
MHDVTVSFHHLLWNSSYILTSPTIRFVHFSYKKNPIFQLQRRSTHDSQITAISKNYDSSKNNIYLQIHTEGLPPPQAAIVKCG